MTNTNKPPLSTELSQLRYQVAHERKLRERAEAVAERRLRQLHFRQQAVELIEAVVSAATQACSVDEVFESCTRCVCESLQCNLGHYYVIDPEEVSHTGKQAVSSGWYHAGGDRVAPFRVATEEMGFEHLRRGFIGRVLKFRRAVWITNIWQQKRFLRAQAAQEAGLQTAFSFSVQENGRVVALFEFFSTRNSEPPEPLLHALERIGVHLELAIERQRVKSRLIYEAFHDPLTTLPNRAKLLERLQLLLDRGHLQSKARFAVLFINLDSFRSVNSSLGHAEGDAIIAEIGRRIAASVRRDDLIARNVANDAACDQNIVARMGGDEFTVVLDGVHEPGDAIRVAQRIQRSMAAPLSLSGQTLYISATIGIALNTHDGIESQDMIRNAAIAMYRAKARGRARFEVFDEAMGVHAKSTLKRESELHEALEHHEFCLLYQPILSMEDTAIRGFEALLRWRHPTLGVIAPDEFLVTTEETGLIHAIGHWVLEEACRQAVAWIEEFPSDPPLVMCVNVSASQLGEIGFVDYVHDTLVKTGLQPMHLNLELTESVAVADLDRAQDILLKLKALGVRLSLDDFGTGYSSLNYLRHLPIDVLKIDRSFISGLDSNTDNQRLVGTIVMLADAFHLKTVAEGPETEEELFTVHQLGCDFAQGYYFFRPLDATDATDVLRKERPGVRVTSV